MSFAFGIGIGTQNNQGEWLEVYYQQPIMTPDRDLIDVVESALDYKGGNQAISVKAEQLAQFANTLRQLGR
ncbi:MAG TPA: 2,3,4,5-tetrahydropyridine-2,6-dicarboxylate N-succinyltransferase, partial [Marinobacter hydrocarbonoclasticus]|nr:2,3,4,5-tetrahydropyridine-2,6-dicarboxylate N-succinyltransferase [Marinobacter nauticus]